MTRQLPKSHSRWAFYRNALLGSGALSLVVFAVHPLAPPRFLPEHGFVDATVVMLGLAIAATRRSPTSRTPRPRQPDGDTSTRRETAHV